MSQRKGRKNKAALGDLPVIEYRTRSGRRVKKPDRWNPSDAELTRDFQDGKIDTENPDSEPISDKQLERSSPLKNVETCSESLAVDSLSEPMLNPKINTKSKINTLNSVCDSFDDSLNELLPNKKKSASALAYDSGANRKSREKQLLGCNTFYDSLEDICSLTSNIEKISGSEGAQNVKNVVSERSLAVEDSLMIDISPKGNDSDEQHFEEDSLAIIEHEKAFDDSLEEAELIEMLSISRPDDNVVVEYAKDNAAEQVENNANVTQNLFQTTVELSFDKKSLIASGFEKNVEIQSKNEDLLSAFDCVVSEDSLESSKAALISPKTARLEEVVKYENEVHEIKSISPSIPASAVSNFEQKSNISINEAEFNISICKNEHSLNSSENLPPKEQLETIEVSQLCSDHNAVVPTLLNMSAELEKEYSFNKSTEKIQLYCSDVTLPLSFEPNDSCVQENNDLSSRQNNMDNLEENIKISISDSSKLSSDIVDDACYKSQGNEIPSSEMHDSSTSDGLQSSSLRRNTPKASLNDSLQAHTSKCQISDLGSQITSSELAEDKINFENSTSAEQLFLVSPSKQSSSEKSAALTSEDLCEPILDQPRTPPKAQNLSSSNRISTSKGCPSVLENIQQDNKQYFKEPENKTVDVEDSDSEDNKQYFKGPEFKLNIREDSEDDKQYFNESKLEAAIAESSDSEEAECSSISSDSINEEEGEKATELFKETCAAKSNDSVEKVGLTGTCATINTEFSRESFPKRASLGMVSSNDSRNQTWNSHEKESLTGEEDVVHTDALNDSVFMSKDIHVTSRAKSSHINQNLSLQNLSFDSDSSFKVVEVKERVDEMVDDSKVSPVSNEPGYIDDSICIVHESCIKTESRITGTVNNTIYIDDSMYLMPEINIKSELEDEVLSGSLASVKESQILNNTICLDDSMENSPFESVIKKENLDYKMDLSQAIPIVDKTICVDDTICINDTMHFPSMSNDIKIENQDSDDDTYYSCSSEIVSEKSIDCPKIQHKNDFALIVDQDNFAIPSNLKKQITKKALEVAKSKSSNENLVKLQIKVAVSADQVNILSIVPPKKESQEISHRAKESSAAILESPEELKANQNSCSVKKNIGQPSLDDFSKPSTFMKVQKSNKRKSLQKTMCAETMNFESDISSEEPKLIEALDLHDVSLSFCADRLVDSRDSIKPLNLCLRGVAFKQRKASKIDEKENMPVSNSRNLLKLPLGSGKIYASPQADRYKSPKIFGSGTESKKSATKIPVRKMDNISPVCSKPYKDFKDELVQPASTAPLFRGKLFTPVIGGKAREKAEITPAKSQHFCTVRNSISRVPKAPRSCPKKFQYVQSPIAQYIRSNRVLTPTNNYDNVFLTPNSALPSHPSKAPGIPQITSQKLHLQKVNKKL